MTTYTKIIELSSIVRTLTVQHRQARRLAGIYHSTKTYNYWSQEMREAKRLKRDLITATTWLHSLMQGYGLTHTQLPVTADKRSTAADYYALVSKNRANNGQISRVVI